MLFDLQDGPTTGPFGPVPALANLFPAPENTKAQTTPGISGQSGCGSSASAALQSFLESRLLTQLGGVGSMEYSETWKRKATPAGRPYLAHTASAHRKFDNEFGGWPSPAHHDGRRLCGGKGCKQGTSLSRDTVLWLTGWPTPNTMQGGATSRSGERKDEFLVGGLVRGLSSMLSTAAMENHGALSPAHSRWLMGFPGAWDQRAPGANEWNSWQQRLTKQDDSKATAMP